jgi:hypothetical protein
MVIPLKDFWAEALQLLNQTVKPKPHDISVLSQQDIKRLQAQRDELRVLREAAKLRASHYRNWL